MIERLHVRGFKALRDVTVDLTPLTVIVGPNASGKTSILEAIDAIGRLGFAPLLACLPALPHDVLTRTDEVGVDEATIHAEFSREFGALQFVELTLGRQSSNVRFSGSSEGVSYERVAKLDSGRRVESLAQLRVFKTRLLRLAPSVLKSPSASGAMNSEIGDDGANLAAALADLKLTSPEHFDRLCALVAAVVPSLQSIEFDKVQSNREEYVAEESGGTYRLVKVVSQGYGLKFRFVGTDALPAGVVSEGTLITLGLLTHAVLMGLPTVFLVDEFERGLHPRALGSLIKQLRRFLSQNKQMQIIATTHSPYVLDHLEAEEVLVTTLGDDGGVIAGKFTEHPEFEKWKDEMSPGEFWAAVGEDWLKDRKAKQP